MDKDSFTARLRDVFQRDDPLTVDMAPADLPEWDSLTIMAAIAMVRQHFGKALNLAEFQKLASVKDIYVLLAGA